MNSGIFALAYIWQEEILGFIEALINYSWNKNSRVLFDRLISDSHVSNKYLLDWGMRNQIGTWINVNSQNEKYLEYTVAQYLYAYFFQGQTCNIG